MRYRLAEIVFDGSYLYRSNREDGFAVRSAEEFPGKQKNT